MTKHLQICDGMFTPGGGDMDPFTCAEILATTTKNIIYFSILEALYIREENRFSLPKMSTRGVFYVYESDGRIFYYDSRVLYFQRFVKYQLY